MNLLRAGVTASVCFGVILATATGAAAAHVRTLYSFGADNGGRVPEAAPIFGDGGNLYGTTSESGQSGTCGTVYRLAPDGTETQLHIFNCSEPGDPVAPLISDRNGNLFGTTYSGIFLSGGIFEIASDGSYSLLYQFSGENGDGANPGGALLERNGQFYGTTNYGGGAPNAGIVFRMAKGGTPVPIYTFSGGSDGANSNATLIADRKGNLYGTTQRGGSTGCSSSYGPGCGVVFRLSPKGKETVLHTFMGGVDGIWPQSGVVADADGNLYGTTWEGGSTLYTYGCGTVYRITPESEESVLHAFRCGKDGSAPYASLLVDAKGNVYGTATHGGNENACAGGCGTVFKITPDGRFSVLLAFVRGKDGSGAYSSLIEDRKGRLYGTTLYGGEYDYGVVFRLTQP
ncbi:MAG TPA: choice-of-anchor tandem repeat GloVer-containing protein [Rhizomicrobium sp.]|nr:choice-of-anchor tandem repeat GloVer-containing protein [Rhizomicrobium sp.]